MSKKQPYKFKFDIAVQNGEIHPLSMINASIKSGTPVQILGERISNFEIEKDGKIIDINDMTDKISGNIKIGGIILYPGKIIPLKLKVPNSEIEFDNLHFRGIKKRKKKKISTEDRNYPYKFELIFDENKLNLNFKIVRNSNAKQSFKWEKFLRILNKERKFVLIDKETEKTVFKIGDLPGKPVDNEWYKSLQKLTQIQECTNITINIPNDFELTSKEIYKIDQAVQIINEGEIEYKLDNIEFTLKIKDVKSMLNSVKSSSEKPFLELRPHDDYKMNIFDQEINLGPFRTRINSFDILNKSELETKLERTNDEENVRMKIKPQKTLNIFTNYPYC